MKKVDIIITISVLIIAIVFFGVNQYKSYLIEKNSSELWVEIYVDTELYRVISLFEKEEEFVIEDFGKNIIKIHDKGIEIIDSDCPEHICESVGFIDKPGEIIVCLPNKVVIEIKGGTQNHNLLL